MDIIIFSYPAGGVATGWQVVLRSKNIYGPYEWKTVLAQGETKITDLIKARGWTLLQEKTGFYYF